MPEARLTPAEWMKQINAALSAGGMNADIKTAWNELKGKTVYDGAWHKNVKERVVAPYNTIYGGWAKNTIVGKTTYTGISELHACGSLYWVRGLVMPGGFDSIRARKSSETTWFWATSGSGSGGPPTGSGTW